MIFCMLLISVAYETSCKLVHAATKVRRNYPCDLNFESFAATQFSFLFLSFYVFLVLEM